MKKFLIAAAAAVLAAFAVPAFAATNPFMDVPASHWAYDAVAQLASRGVISGYPDGSYKGAQPATRYEMASIVARAMAKIDMEKAGKQDVEMLKKLIVEFKDELDALGVKVDQIDSRLAVMERDLGGWNLAGELRFDALFGSEDSSFNDNITGKNQFDLNRFRLFMNRRINDKVNFYSRIVNDDDNRANGNMVWDRYYVTVELPYDILMTIGRQEYDWEGDLGFYHGDENDATVGNYELDMIRFEKSWGMANLDIVFGRNYDYGDLAYETADGLWEIPIEQFHIAAKLHADFNEKFYGGLMAYYFFTDEEVRLSGSRRETDTDQGTYGIYAGFRFTPAIELKGVYYFQSLGETYAWLMNRDDGRSTYGNASDDPKAWKAILDVNQVALKFTSLWLEYSQIDNHFMQNTFMQDERGGNWGTYSYMGTDPLHNRPFNNNTTNVILARADQQWNDKWRTFVRYMQADFDTAGLDDAKNWTLGVAYRYNPAVEFELNYDHIDYGDNNAARYGGSVHGGDTREGDEGVVRFRTFVSF